MREWLGLASCVVLFVALALLLLHGDTEPPHAPPRAPAPVGDNRPATGVDPAASPETASPAPVAPGPAAISGLVLEEGTDAPVADADVRAFDYATRAEAAARTDAAGRFTVPGTTGTAGLFTVVIEKPGFARAAEEAVRASPEPRVFRLSRGGALAGRVVAAPDRRPVTSYRILAVRLALSATGAFDARAVLRRQAVPESIAAEAVLTVSDPGGRFAFPALRPGAYALAVFAEGFAPAFENGGGHFYDFGRGFDVATGAPPAEVVVELARAGVVRFRVRDAATGEPLFDARFSAGVDIERRACSAPQTPLSVSAEGVYELPVAVDAEGRIGDTSYVVGRDGYADRFFSFSGQSEGEVFEVALSRPARVRGTVLDAAGAAVPGAVVLVERDLNGGLLETLAADGAGRYETGPLDADLDITLHFFGSTLAEPVATVPVRLRPGEVRTVDVGAPGTGALHGLARLAGRPAAVRICLDADAGRRVIVDAGPDGAYQFEGLPPDAYEVTALFDAAGGETFFEVSRRVTLHEGERLRVDFTDTLSIAGMVMVGDERAPLAAGDGAVEIRSRRTGEEAPVSTATCDADGGFRIWVDGPGIYELDCPSSDRYVARAAVRVELTAGRSVEGVEVLVDRDDHDGHIRIEVRDSATDEPIAEGTYRYRHKTSSGAGTFEGGVIEQADCGLGGYRFDVEAEGYAASGFDIEIAPTAKGAERVVRLERSDAVRVVDFLPDSPAAAAGLAVGDVILRYGDERVRNVDEIRAAIQRSASAGSVALSILRERRPLTFDVPAGRLGVMLEGVRIDDR